MWVHKPLASDKPTGSQLISDCVAKACLYLVWLGFKHGGDQAECRTIFEHESVWLFVVFPLSQQRQQSPKNNYSEYWLTKCPVQRKQVINQNMLRSLNHSVVAVVWQHLFVMDILQEFLESSTIHGLSYISTSKVGDNIKHWFGLLYCCISYKLEFQIDSFLSDPSPVIGFPQ